MLQKYHIFLQYIDDISVSLCCKNSDLVGKTVQKLANQSQNAAASVGHWGLPSTYIYINTQKWFFEGGYGPLTKILYVVIILFIDTRGCFIGYRRV